ncbi:hypothetical protein FS837_001643 [Tulasnella sp. UAMH 9824]|nr:hypothetical protein FS837_001643 [Tulasnella sp. UAMH 9824]
MSNPSSEAVDVAQDDKEGGPTGLSEEVAPAAAEDCSSGESIDLYEAPYRLTVGHMALGNQPAGPQFYPDTYSSDYNQSWRRLAQVPYASGTGDVYKKFYRSGDDDGDVDL